MIWRARFHLVDTKIGVTLSPIPESVPFEFRCTGLESISVKAPDPFRHSRVTTIPRT